MRRRQESVREAVRRILHANEPVFRTVALSLSSAGSTDEEIARVLAVAVDRMLPLDKIPGVGPFLEVADNLILYTLILRFLRFLRRPEEKREAMELHRTRLASLGQRLKRQRGAKFQVYDVLPEGTVVLEYATSGSLRAVAPTDVAAELAVSGSAWRPEALWSRGVPYSPGLRSPPKGDE